MTLLVAATERELCGFEGLVCGIGPVEAAAATAQALAQVRPNAVLHVGIAGGRGIAPPALVLGSEAVYCDVSTSARRCRASRASFRTRGCLAAARAALPGARSCYRSGRARGSAAASEFEVEAMEGFAVLRAAAARRRARRSSCARSRTRSPSPTARAGDSTEALAALAAALPRLLSALG